MYKNEKHKRNRQRIEANHRRYRLGLSFHRHIQYTYVCNVFIYRVISSRVENFPYHIIFRVKLIVGWLVTSNMCVGDGKEKVGNTTR